MEKVCVNFNTLLEQEEIYETDAARAEKYIDRLIDRQPTITIRPGRSIKLLVSQKLTLEPLRF